jgi:hypothetical protein
MRRTRWAVLAFVPVLLSGCGVLGLSSPPASSGGGGATTSPSGPSWIVVAQGSATPSPVPSGGAPAPTMASGFLPLPNTPIPIGTPSVSCSPNTFNFTKIAAADVTPSTTSAVVSWYNVGGYNLKEFRLTAISQDLLGGRQRDIGFVVVTPSVPCGPMTAKITGLDRKTGYVFSVDAVVQRRSGDGTHAATVARSHVIYTG